MSIAAYSLAIRDYLRANLVNFYDGDETNTNANCKVMLDEKPTANSGQEFIAIYGGYHQPRDKRLIEALEEEFGLTIAVSRKIALIPPDYRGELGYLNIMDLPDGGTQAKPATAQDDIDRWNSAWVSVEDRCREITRLLAGSNRYNLMQVANGNLLGGSPFTEPLRWLHTDSYPKQVGPEHFTSYEDDLKPDADPTFGLVMKVYLGEAIRMQPLADLDRIFVPTP